MRKRKNEGREICAKLGMTFECWLAEVKFRDRIENACNGNNTRNHSVIRLESDLHSAAPRAQSSIFSHSIILYPDFHCVAAEKVNRAPACANSDAKDVRSVDEGTAFH